MGTSWNKITVILVSMTNLTLNLQMLQMFTKGSLVSEVKSTKIKLKLGRKSKPNLPATTQLMEGFRKKLEKSAEK